MEVASGASHLQTPEGAVRARAKRTRELILRVPPQGGRPARPL
jgi:hypothetical protein